MAIVSEHDSKEEGEGHDSEWSWVSLLVVGHSISVNNLLEEGSEVIGLDIGRRVQFCDAFTFLELLKGCSSKGS